MIRCGNCGQGHPTVAEVRSCHGAPTPPPDAQFDGQLGMTGEGFPPPAPRRAPQRRSTTAPPRATSDLPPLGAQTVDQLAGPTALGRALVIAPGGAVAEPWAAADRVAVDTTARVPDAILDELQRAWSERRRIVIERTGAVPDGAPVLSLPWWEWDPDLELVGERLHHLLTANAVDATDPTALRFVPLQRALAAGATAHPDADIDIDGRGAWVDGGPLAWFDDLAEPVVPAANLIHGRLDPLRVGDPTAELAADQLAAVAHGGGGARIIAPAGSGKTRVLTERVRHLVRDRNVAASGVCLVAFNVRAREEMQERTTDLEGLEIRTLNSLALAICNGSGPFATPRNHRRVEVIDEPRVRRILDDLVKVRRQAMTDPIASWIEALGSSRLGLRSPSAVERDFGGDAKDFAQVAPRYVELLNDRNLVDFDQQILRAIDILLTDPDARARARQVCGQLLVDEFQDLTPAHVLLVRLLGGPRAEVFGVGDDDQTIYGYSGASPDWLIDFADLFPGSTSHDLQINYRCPPEVVEAAATLLTHNRQRVDKVINARPGREPSGALTTSASDDPAEDLVAHIKTLVADKVKPRDIAVLTRVNATLLAPFIALSNAGIGTTKPVDSNFLGRTGISGALAWLELATAPSQKFPSAALATAARRPPRALHPRVVDWISEKRSIKELEAMAGWLRDERDGKKVLGFSEHVELVRSLADDGATTRQLLEAVRDDVGLGGALDSRLDASRRAVDRSSHGDDLSALLSIADLHPDASDFTSWLSKQLESIEHQGSGVRLSTVHKVKGREWPHVIVYEATAGLFPHRLAENVEEERRVFHVALTRGATSVHVISSPPASTFLPQMVEARDPNEADPEPVRERRTPKESKPRRTIPEASTLEVASLREKLRAWRTDKCKADAVPAYVIFSDATLVELSEFRPTTEDALLDIKGIGPAKVDKFGAELLTILTEG